MNRIFALLLTVPLLAGEVAAQRGSPAAHLPVARRHAPLPPAALPKEVVRVCTPAPVKGAPVQHGRSYRGGAPVNDNCAGAIQLTVGSSCLPVQGNTAGASQSLAAITCATFVGNADDDVWYKFTATAAALTVRVDGSSGFDAVVDVRSGACNGANIACADATISDGVEQVSLTGLTIGATYLVRVYDYDQGVPLTTDFTICVFGTAQPPSNDQCFNVVGQPLAVGGSINFSGTTAGATATSDAVAASDLDDGVPKVWHRFTTSTCATITIEYCGTSPEFDQVYTALTTTCPANAFVPGSADFTSCVDGNATITFTQVPAGSYYFPVGQFGAATTGPYAITVSAQACAPAPANDECTGAVVLTVGSTCQYVQGDVSGASQSLPGILCNGFTGTANDDVWYSFVATAAQLTIEVAGSDSMDAVIELRSGPCANGISVACGDATFLGGTEVIQATGLTVGQTYFVRVYDYYVAEPATTTFEICVFGGGALPGNDNCANVNPVPLALGNSVNFTGTTVGATATGDAVPGSPMDDNIPKVWHAFTLSACADVTVSYCGTTPAFDEGYVVWTTCPADTFFLGAYDFSTCADGNLTIAFTGLQPGTYWLPIGRFGSGTTGPYTIEVSAVACAGPPANDDCSAAQQLTVWPVADCPLNSTQGNNQQAVQDGTDPSCDATTGSYLDMWYAFESGGNSVITVDFNNINMGDWVVVVNEGCGGTEVSCDINPAAPFDIQVTPGTSYVVRVYSNTEFGGGGDFEICLSGAINTGLSSMDTPAWTVFPNPSAGGIAVVWPAAAASALTELIDATGRVVWTSRMNLVKGTNQLVAPSAKPASGSYLLRISTGEGVSGQRVVVH